MLFRCFRVRKGPESARRRGVIRRMKRNGPSLDELGDEHVVLLILEIRGVADHIAILVG